MPIQKEDIERLPLKLRRCLEEGATVTGYHPTVHKGHYMINVSLPSTSQLAREEGRQSIAITNVDEQDMEILRAVTKFPSAESAPTESTASGEHVTFEDALGRGAKVLNYHENLFKKGSYSVTLEVPATGGKSQVHYANISETDLFKHVTRPSRGAEHPRPASAAAASTLPAKVTESISAGGVVSQWSLRAPNSYSIVIRVPHEFPGSRAGLVHVLNLNSEEFGALKQATKVPDAETHDPPCIHTWPEGMRKNLSFEQAMTHGALLQTHREESNGQLTVHVLQPAGRRTAEFIPLHFANVPRDIFAKFEKK